VDAVSLEGRLHRLDGSAAALIAELDRELSMIRSCLDALAIRRRRGPRRFWTEAERQELRRLYPDTSTAVLARRMHRRKLALYQQAQQMGLRKSAAYLRSPACIAFIRPGSGGVRFRFPKGNVPHNKGLRRPGWWRGRMRETQFKKGQAPINWHPVGTEVRDRDGYLKRKISDDRAKPSRFNWKFVHVLTWEAQHGPVPRGHAVVFKNGDKADIRGENLELVTRQELMRRNSVHNLPPALAQVVQLRGALVRQIRKRAMA
jgi:HNH endonuclease